jgi:hypothetical protein
MGAFYVEGTAYDVHQLRPPAEDADKDQLGEDIQGADSGDTFHHYYDESKGEVVSIMRSQSGNVDDDEDFFDASEGRSKSSPGRTATAASSAASPTRKGKRFLGKAGGAMTRGLKSLWGQPRQTRDGEPGDKGGSESGSASGIVTSGGGGGKMPVAGGKGGFGSSMAAACAAAASASRNTSQAAVAGAGLDDEGNFEGRPSVFVPNGGDATGFGDDATLNENVDYVDPELEEMKHAYVGDEEYADLLVSENIDLYFSCQVFSWGKAVNKPHAYLAMGPTLLEKEANSEFYDTFQEATKGNDLDNFDFNSPSAKGLASFTRFVSKPPRPEGFIGLYPTSIIDVPALDETEELANKAVINTTKKNASASLASRFRRKASASNLVSPANAAVEVAPGASSNAEGPTEGAPPAANGNGLRPSAQMSNEQPITEYSMFLVLTDCCFYFVYANSIPPTARFRDVPVPLVFRVHPLVHLR